MDFTVVIPTYNGAERIPQVLDRLRSQIDVGTLNWEILIVDNNSTDHTAELVQNIQSDWGNHRTPQLRYAFEPVQGAAFARQRGMQSVQSEWVGFLDDDIIPADNWVAAAYEFCQTHPEAGAFGGQIHGNFEVPPPDNFQRIQSFLAIRERGATAHLYRPEHLILPPSAAWVVKRQVWLTAVPPNPQLRGRTQGSMVQGDDYEPLIFMHKAGHPIWYNPEMHVHHQIPKRRLERDYLISLSRGCGLCVCSLQMLRVEPWQAPLTLLRLTLGSLKRLVMHRLKYGDISQIDLVTECERAFYVSSLISPLYFLENLFKPAFFSKSS
ncbi:MAG: hormogonium polysaccharide biosynthesis glycosyltransferase HpsE [Leptolyngbyaceae cyanobacterium MO_188.B28]|nr:hormogonium polysaccharide biosynthesis glycosyltransferase HpsE [Leptolyngbyaceae cyanobacterium MO_188.B28]